MADAMALLQRAYYEAIIMQQRVVNNLVAAPSVPLTLSGSWPIALRGSATMSLPVNAAASSTAPACSSRVTWPPAARPPHKLKRHGDSATREHRHVPAVPSGSSAVPNSTQSHRPVHKANGASKIFRPWDDGDSKDHSGEATPNAVTPPAVLDTTSMDESPASSTDHNVGNNIAAAAAPGSATSSGDAQPNSGGGDWQVTLENFATNMGRTALGHRCLYCGKMYSRKYGLKIHLRTHTGFKPLKCRVCQRAFGDPSNLNKHTRLHVEKQQQLQLRPDGTVEPLLNAMFKCPVCGKLMLRQRDLDKHIANRHAHRPPVDPQHS